MTDVEEPMGLRYIKLVKSLMKKMDFQNNLIHFSSGLAAEYSEYLLEDREEDDGELDFYARREEKILKELGDMLFYAYALGIELNYFIYDELPNLTGTPPHSPLFRINTEGYNQIESLCSRMADMRFDYVTNSMSSADAFNLFLATRPLEYAFKWKYHNAVLDLGKMVQAVEGVLNMLSSVSAWHSMNLERVVAPKNMEKLMKRHPNGFRGVAWKNDGIE